MAREPFLPGFKFYSKQGRDNHLRQQFNFKNGYSIPKLNLESVTTHEPVAFETTYDFIKFDPLERFTKITKPKPSVYKPHFVINNGKCLSFKGYFKQEIPEFSHEKQFYRKISIIYYLEDDSMTIIEPPVANAGYLQGRIVRRGHIPKPNTNGTWHWKHLNVGVDIKIYGITYHISSCDQFTREYLLSQGIEVNENEDIPKNTFEKNHSMQKFGYYCGTQDIPSQDKLYRFLQYDRKVLRFYALWDDRGNEFGEVAHYKVHYYLIDDTVEIMQIKNKFKQNEPFTRLLRRTRLPKNYAPGNALQLNVSVSYNAHDREFYEPEDFRVGNTISVLGREFLLYDCDLFTRRYYRDCLKIEQPTAISISETRPEPIKREIPPHSGIGQPQDTLQSCLSIVPRPPKKDIIHYIENTNKMLRYSAQMDTTSENDKDRKFIIQYSLADGKISIYEIKTLNSGFPSGYFLKSALVPKPPFTDNAEYYSPTDFAIGSTVEIFARKFLITGADVAVYRYMEKRPQKFRPEVMESVKQYLQREGIIDDESKEIEHVTMNEEHVNESL